MEWDWAEVGKTWLQLLDALQPPVIWRGGVKFPDPLASPFGDVIEGVGTPDDARRERKRRLFAELYGKPTIGESLADYGVKSERNEKMNEREIERQVLEEVRAEREERRLADAKTKVTAALDALGEDTYDEHTVLRFEKTHGARLYTYAVLKANDLWYRTGRDCMHVPQSMTWDDLTLWLVSGTPVTELTVMAPVSGEKSDGIPDKRETPR